MSRRRENRKRWIRRKEKSIKEKKVKTRETSRGLLNEKERRKAGKKRQEDVTTTLKGVKQDQGDLGQSPFG